MAKPDEIFTREDYGYYGKGLMVLNRGMVVNHIHKVNADGVVQAYAKSTYGIVGTLLM
jgi:hypothetical protein